SEALAPLVVLAGRVRASTLVPTSIDLASEHDGHGTLLAIRFESGVEEAVTDQAATVGRLAAECGLDQVQSLVGGDGRRCWGGLDSLLVAESGASPSLLLKTSLLPEEVARWLDTLGVVQVEAGVTARFRAHAGHGIVFVRLSGDRYALMAAVERL